ncbi:class I SAM-dependent methyltransferase [Altererythrobacter sp. Root672]|uniref:class I SAM-dependent methyltransferase n=1 Tax=Altererythrobacter sp. Root672 TaxID=1736584 RepID=UPI0006FAC2F1|nr:class I SAM-dependent methyltransferase [Altererythrobacter sp. Root672]KRA83198.1 methyltransferase type 11 [Altererythrobacter sp. Root672]
MTRPSAELVAQVFTKDLAFVNGYTAIDETSQAENQQQTNEIFSEKWDRYASTDELETFYQFQRDWYLKLYGFADEDALRQHLASCRVILDAGCGLGYKAAWFAKLAPHALVVGMDFSAAAAQAAELFANIENLVFIRGDIAKTPFRDGAVDYVSCDQVIMHTEDPLATFAELARITEPANGQFACYFYAKKALPRELLDDYFRIHCKEVTTEQLWEMSEQLTDLGKRLSELQVSIDVPEIPLLGIKGGQMDIQRFIYWNFLKCFWNESLGHDTSVVTNFDWYSPSNARRFSSDEVHDIVSANRMMVVHFHSEEAAHSGRFLHQR